MKITITKIVIVKHSGKMDTVVLNTNLPSATPFVTSETNTLHFYAERDTGAEYCGTHFPTIPVEIVGD